MENTIKYKTDILTGLRPSSNLTIANYLGAIKPILDLQEEGREIIVFIADIHALTDNEPEVARKYSKEVAKDYIALGLNPTITHIFLQSAISEELSLLTMYLSRLVTVAELLRVPALKDKIKTGENRETANALLLLYPVIMAGDILLPFAEFVPVGEDQSAHIEVARKLASRFNKKYGETFPMPKPLNVETLKILSLKGDTKMSKSYQEGAIFLNDDKDTIAKKINRAETGMEGEITPSLKSLLIILEKITGGEKTEEIEILINKHMGGEKVMGELKRILIEAVTEFTSDFQKKRAQIGDDEVLAMFEKEGKYAKKYAQETIKLVENAMGLN